MRIGGPLFKLSQLTIDGAKDWQAKDITNTGHIGLDGNSIKFTDVAFFQENSTQLRVATLDRASTRSLKVNELKLIEGITGDNSSLTFQTQASDNAYIILKARQNGVGNQEVARMTGGVNPTFDLLAGRLTGDLDVNSKQLTNMAAAVGDRELLTLNTERSTTSATYAIAKRIQVPFAGSYRVTYSFKGTMGFTLYGRVYINGVAVGIERSDATGNYTAYSEDFAGLSAEDRIEFYLKGDGTWPAYVMNFRVKTSQCFNAVALWDA